MALPSAEIQPGSSRSSRPAESALMSWAAEQGAPAAMASGLPQAGLSSGDDEECVAAGGGRRAGGAAGRPTSAAAAVASIAPAGMGGAQPVFPSMAPSRGLATAASPTPELDARPGRAPEVREMSSDGSAEGAVQAFALEGASSSDDGDGAAKLRPSAPASWDRDDAKRLGSRSAGDICDRDVQVRAESFNRVGDGQEELNTGNQRGAQVAATATGRGWLAESDSESSEDDGDEATRPPSTSGGGTAPSPTAPSSKGAVAARALATPGSLAEASSPSLASGGCGGMPGTALTSSVLQRMAARRDASELGGTPGSSSGDASSDRLRKAPAARKGAAASSSSSSSPSSRSLSSGSPQGMRRGATAAASTQQQLARGPAAQQPCLVADLSDDDSEGSSTLR